MKTFAANDLGSLRSLTTELLSRIDTWIEGADDPGCFRHRLLRAHAVAMLDELEYLASDRRGRGPQTAPEGPDAPRGHATPQRHTPYSSVEQKRQP